MDGVLTVLVTVLLAVYRVHASQKTHYLSLSVKGVGGVWFVGAYALLSVPLLENGVNTAIQVTTIIVTVTVAYGGGSLYCCVASSVCSI